MMYGLTQLHNDCMELFSYYAGECVEAMVVSTKRSLEAVKLHIYSPQYDKIDRVMCQQ